MHLTVALVLPCRAAIPTSSRRLSQLESLAYWVSLSRCLLLGYPPLKTSAYFRMYYSQHYSCALYSSPPCWHGHSSWPVLENDSWSNPIFKPKLRAWLNYSGATTAEDSNGKPWRSAWSFMGSPSSVLLHISLYFTTEAMASTEQHFQDPIFCYF